MRTSAEWLSMNERRVLITGAESGIGHAMAHRFAEAGADLDLVDINEGGLARLADELSCRSRRVTTYVVNLTDRAAIAARWDTIGADVPDTLINNAGSYPMRDYEDIDCQFLEMTLQVVNLTSAL
jgi:NADP-dependent 3-hydroxy acid dehydrogenase YdfG